MDGATVGLGAATDGAPTGNGVRVQSGSMPPLAFCPGDASGTDSIASSSSLHDANASSHFSLDTSTPPVLSALYKGVSNVARRAPHVGWLVTYPANDPPTQAIDAGVNAGALPAFAAARGDADDADGCDGAGLLRIAMCGMSGRRAA